MPSLAPLVVLLSLLIAAPAQAEWFPAEVIDGPAPGIERLGGIDIARDGDGGLVYLKSDAGVPHVYLSRHAGGKWTAPERVDVGVETAASEAVVSASDGGRLVVAFISGGRLYGSVIVPGPVPAPSQLYADADPLRAVSNVAVDQGINGHAYVTFTAPGGGGSDVRVVRLQDATWTGVDSALDIRPDQPAGEGTGRADVAVAADGNAVVVWGEGHPDGRSRVFGRRVTGLAVSQAPQEISLDTFAGAGGGPADAPDVDIEDDVSFAWVAFRQQFGGTPRAIARRLVGSLFEAPVALDGGTAGEPPRVNITGRGVGASAAVGTDGTVFSAPLRFDEFGPPVGIAGAGASPVVEITEKDDAGVAYLRGGGLLGRYQPDGENFAPEALLSRGEWGPSARPAIAADRFGDLAVAFEQGGNADRRIVVAVFDRPPSTAVGTSTGNWQRRSRPRLRWKESVEVWGPVTYKLIVDGGEIGSTGGPEFVPVTPLEDGVHAWRVMAVDQRGQSSLSRERFVRIDTVRPEVSLRVSGKRKRGATLKFSVRASDPDGSGLKYAFMDFGRPPYVYARRASRRFGGKVAKIRVKVADRAGNVTQIRKTIRLRK